MEDSVESSLTPEQRANLSQSAPPRLLVRGVNWLGDAVMSTPAILRLREAFPKSEIALLTHEKIAELWSGHPGIDRTLTFSKHDSVFTVARRIRAAGFDCALILPNSARSALEALLAGISKRVGHSGSLRSLFLTQRVEPREGRIRMHKLSQNEIAERIAPSSEFRVNPMPQNAHQTLEYLHLAASLGANPEPLEPLLVLGDDEIRSVAVKFGLQGSRTKPVIGLNPGAEYGPAKRWPLERFIETAKLVGKESNCAWVVFGGKNDTEAAGNLERALKNPGIEVHNLAGRTSLRDLMGVLKVCRVLLTNDTGPMHVAAALGTPVVVPFGSTSPELTGPGLPGSKRHRLLRAGVPCSPCFRRECPIDFRCMTGISVESVVEAVLGLMAGPSSP